MLLLTATTHTLEVITSSTSAIDYTASYVDITTTTFTPGSTQGLITTATTTPIVSAPGSSTQRQMKFLSITNQGGTDNNITFQKDVSGTNYIILKTITLASGDSLQYTDGEGWKILDSTGAIKTSGSGGSGTVLDGDYGDITVSGTGTVWSIDTPGLVTLASTDKILLKDTSAADAMGYVAATNIASQATSVGTLTTGVWNATAIDLSTYATGTLAVTAGGTGRTSGASAYGLIAAGTTATGAHQTIANAASGTILQSTGTGSLAAWTTSTYPGTVGTIGCFLRSDGTNFVNSTVTWFTDTCARGDLVVGRTTNNIKFLPIGSSGQLVTNDGTDVAWSAVTYPTTSATSRKMVVSNGTNFVASTETWAVPGTSGNVLTSDGTNWTSAAPSSGGGITWNTASGTTQAAAVNNAYVTTNAAQCVITLPATAAVGSIVAAAGQGAGGWQLKGNTGQTIQLLGTATSSAGTITPANRYDTIEVVCIVANTTWSVRHFTSTLLTTA